MPRDLSRLLRPRSIAVIGGGAWGANAVAQCRAMGFEGPVWPVHPRRESLGGLPCRPSVEALPEPPDAAFLAINRDAAVEAVAALAARGAGGAVCFASGFAEAEAELAGGRAAQERLVAAAGEMPVLGPNCYGLVNYLDGAVLWPDQHGGRRRGRGVAVVAQSSNMLINLTMAPGLPLAVAVAAGNQAQVSQAEIGAALLEDPRVTALGLHVEGVGDPRAWERLSERARALAKPVVALKIGRSAAAQAAALSHTASLAGGHAAARAFFARLGIALVESLPDLVAALALLDLHGALPGARIGVVSSSGGEASLVADMAEGRALALPPLGGATRGRLAAALGPRVALANPLDYHTYIWGDVPRMRETFAAMLAGGHDLTLLIVDFPRADRCSGADWDCALAALAGAVAETGARAAAVATLPGGMPEDRAEAFAAAGVAPLSGIGEALAAVEAAAAIGRAWARPPAAPLLLPEPVAPGAAVTLDEAAAKAALAAHGLAVPAGEVAATPAAAAAAAARLGGRLALKGLGHAHKTEAGAVRLGLAPGEVARAAAEMAEAGAAPGGVLVERMVEGAVAELILGVLRDPAHGLALTLGSGGVLAELVADSRTLLLPAGPEEIRAALGELRVARLLAGHRGRPAGDMAAAVAAAAALAAYAAAEPRLLEAEVNPLIVTPGGAAAADALIRLAPGPASSGL